LVYRTKNEDKDILPPLKESIEQVCYLIEYFL